MVVQLGGVGFGRDEQVAYPEPGVRSEGSPQVGLAELAGPQAAGDIGLDAGAVPFTVHEAGAVSHGDQGADGAFQGAKGALPVLAHAQVNGTGVAFGTVRPVG